MTTASVLLTVSTWNCASDKYEREVGRAARSVTGVAARELRETAATREQALRLMRDWLRQNKDVANVRQDESFLLRFLRHKKYSIPMAQQTLLKYLNLRKLYPEGFSYLDCEEERVKEILNDGFPIERYIMVSPVRDSKGRRVVVYSISNFNASKFSCWDMCRAHVLVYESCMEDPVDQVCGFTHVGDALGANAAHVTAWNPTEFARLIKWGEQSLPMRQKEVHLIHLPAPVRYVIDFAVTRVPPKMADRLKIHANVKSLHKYIDTACLPTSFGGAVQTQDMIQYTKSLLTEQRTKLLSLDDMEILSSRGITTSRSKAASNADAVEGSFRKLEID